MSAFKSSLIIGQILGAISLLLGFYAFYVGVSGNFDFFIQADTLQAKFVNATPGVLLSLIGFLIIWRYKPKESKTITEERIIKDNFLTENNHGHNYHEETYKKTESRDRAMTARRD